MYQRGSTIVLTLIAILALGTIGFVIYKTTQDLEEADIILSPFTKLTQKLKPDQNEYTGEDQHPLGKPLVGVLFGIDRRSRAEGYRTDIMIIIAANPDTNKVVMASIPRDLWYGGGRINALYPAQGWESFQSAVFELTGVKPERFVLTDFNDFQWVVDAMGGVPVEIETTFTDTSYPVDATFEYQTVSFAKGDEKLTGSRALIYARSRKGDFDNGDWGRMKRQHNILKGMLIAVAQPESLFNPMVVEKAYKTVTEGKMDTNLSVMDAKYLWDYYKDKDKYTIESLYMDYDYLYTPPSDEYGGAWVMVPKPGGAEQFKQAILSKLNGTETPIESYLEQSQNNEQDHQ